MKSVVWVDVVVVGDDAGWDDVEAVLLLALDGAPIQKLPLLRKCSLADKG